jgi:hypothetical protein
MDEHSARCDTLPLCGVLAVLLLVASCGGGENNDVATTPTERSTTTISESTTTEATTTSAAATGDPLVGRGEIELISEGYGFTEGPQWIADDGVLLFTDAAGAIFQVAGDDEISVFRRPSDANGLAVDTEGRLLAA